MSQETAIVIFKEQSIRRTWHNNEWWFSLVDVVQALTDSVNPSGYIKDMRRRDPEFSQGWGQIATPLSNLRDHMTDLELIFTMLGEKVTTEISKQEKPQGVPENKKVARRGGKVAGNAGKNTEKELGKSIVSRDNHLKLERQRLLKGKHEAAIQKRIIDEVLK